MSRASDEKGSEAPEGAELFECVRSIVHEEVVELIAQGRVACRDKRNRSGEPGGELDLEPANPSASPMSLWVYLDIVAFSAGKAGAWEEIWSTAGPDWATTLRELVRCVRDGRYSERVKKGRIFFPLKVEMRFRGVPAGTRRRPQADYVVDYGSTLLGADGEQPMPPTGEFHFEPW